MILNGACIRDLSLYLGTSQSYLKRVIEEILNEDRVMLEMMKVFEILRCLF